MVAPGAGASCGNSRDRGPFTHACHGRRRQAKNLIEGHVTEAVGGSDVAGICVTAITSNTSPTLTYDVRTNAFGDYVLSVPDGSYKVRFLDCRPSPYYRPQWWKNATSFAAGTVVKVGTAKTSVVTGIDAALLQGALVTGHVADRATNAPLSGICVIMLYSYGDGHYDQTETTTDANGDYQQYLDNGTYYFWFTDCRPEPVYTDQYWRDASYPAASTAVIVNGAQQQTISGIDAALDRGGSITGRITDDATGQPLTNACVDINARRAGTTVPAAHADSAGNYVFTDLPSGSYVLRFYQCAGFSNSGPTYATEWYDHAASESAATQVTVQAPETTTVNETMFVGGVVSGRVTDASTGLPVAGVDVNADADDTSSSGGATTSADGTFTITGLFASDRYILSFYDPQGRYVTQWWNGKSSAADADYVAVHFGETTAGINEALD